MVRASPSCARHTGWMKMSILNIAMMLNTPLSAAAMTRCRGDWKPMLMLVESTEAASPNHNR